MIIAERFNGPAESGHGGYCAGVFSTAADGAGPIEVTLRRPPPLGVPLSVAGAEIHAPDGELIAEVAAVPPFEAAVAPVPYDEAVELSRSYPGFTEHPFPTCYACGPARSDGLRIYPNWLADGRTAAPLVVPADPAPEMVWAALDCPGGWAAVAAGQISVLGRIAVDIAALPQEGDQCVVMGEVLSTEGRRSLVHTTLYGPGNVLLAQARATWIAI